MHDPIVEEVRKAREEYARKFNYDLDALCQDLRERQRSEGRKVVSFPPKLAQPRAPRALAQLGTTQSLAVVTPGFRRSCPPILPGWPEKD